MNPLYLNQMASLSQLYMMPQIGAGDSPCYTMSGMSYVNPFCFGYPIMGYQLSNLWGTPTFNVNNQACYNIGKTLGTAIGAPFKMLGNAIFG